MKKIINYMSFKGLNTEIEGYGFKYSVKRYMASMIGMFVFVIIIGIVYRLELPYLLGVGVSSIFFVPALIRAQHMFLYQQRRFSEVDVYLHQMIYSFQRMPKISEALEDTLKVTDGEMKACIKRAIEVMRTSGSETILEDSLSEIGNKYKCSRVALLHKFLINIEQKGGEYENSMSVLTKDFDRWVKRTYKNQNELRHIKNNSTIGVILCLIVCTVSVMIITLFQKNMSINVDITSQVAYQVAGTVFMFLMICYYTRAQVSYKGDWLGKARPDEKVKKDFELAFKYDVHKIRMKGMPIVVIVSALAIISFALQYAVIGVVFFIFAVIIIFTPSMEKKSAYNRVVEDLHNGFSEWLRDVALNMQGETLQYAIESTYENCPIVMKQSLEQFIVMIEEDPSDVTPYYEFLSEFNVVDITATVHTLYSLTEVSKENVDKTINSLIEKNCELVDSYEEIKSNDKNSVMKFEQYIPNLFLGAKIAVDMLLLIYYCI